MSKSLLKISAIISAISLSGCSLYMAPWEDPNPYKYEILKENKNLQYPQQKQQDNANLNFTPLSSSSLEKPSYKKEPQIKRYKKSQLTGKNNINSIDKEPVKELAVDNSYNRNLNNAIPEKTQITEPLYEDDNHQFNKEEILSIPIQ